MRYGRGGIEFSGGSGFIGSVDGKLTNEGQKFLQSSARPETKTPVRPLDEWVAGIVTAYLRSHRGSNGGVEVVGRGCFSTSLRKGASVAFLRNHNWARNFGSTATGELELHDSNEGLAFILRPADDADSRSLVNAVKAGELQMSIGYVTDSATMRDIDGTAVRFIDQASLSEVSAVERPAIAETALTVVPAGSIGNLADWCRNGSMKSLVALAHIERKCARLLAALGK